MDECWRVHVACLDTRFEGIEARARNVYSQFGEDGLIEAVFEKIGLKNKWAFEVGAHDGSYLSNTRRFREQGWHCLLVESGAQQFNKLALLASDRVHCVNEHINPTSLDRLLSDCGAPNDMDFGCIDIDGQDYWVWDGMRVHEPRVMLVEFCLREEHDIPPLGDTSMRQATFEPLRRLGVSKGYTPVARTYVNTIFVKDTEL
jgi:hypothetical protein